MSTSERRDECGAMTLEMPYLGPVLILLIVVVARVGFAGSAQLQVEDAARQAARAASLAYTVEEAVALANDTANASLGRQGVRCAEVTVEVDTAGLRPGGQAAVRVSCNLSLPVLRGLPSLVTLRAEAIEVVDVHGSFR